VEEASSRLRDAGIRASGFAIEGEPVHAILDFAKKMQADAIVTGTHGRSGLKRAFVGSVAEGVLRHATVPVLSLRADAKVETAIGGPSMKILVPIDGSETSLHALDVAVNFAVDLHAEIVLCCVTNLADVALLSGGEPQLLPQSLEQLEESSKAILGDAAAKINGRVKVSLRREEGEPVEEIERLAAEIRPAFIVMGSHGRTGVGRALVGSVAEGVLRRAPIPVMVVPAKHPPAA
jgi:nucleotide-binding universal stress UspA family protein